MHGNVVSRATMLVFGFLAALAAPGLAQTTPELSPADVEKAEHLRQDLRQMVTLARDRVFPALVNIKVITVRYWNGKEQKGQAVGSGTIISPDGYVLTNYHVAENGKRFRVTLADKQEVTATLVGEDPFTDLAVLKIDLDELKDPKQPLPFAKFGDSDQLQIGDPVMAMGSPWALSRSVTYGIVSNTERILAGTDDEAEEMRFDADQRTGIFNQWIQHDAAINPGNSGGPLVNLKGELIGVNTRGSFFGGDMGFAIPANLAKHVAGEIMAHGEVPRSWYGMAFKSIKKTGLKEGVLVNSIVDDSPAAKAGLKAGDVIVKIDDKQVTIRFPEEIPGLMKDLADRPVGSNVRVSYQRDGKVTEATIVTEKMKKDRGDEAAFRAWGFTAMGITERMAHERRLDDTKGVLVSSVRSGSPAALAEPAIGEGDVIRTIDGKPIQSLEDFIAIYKELMDREKLPEYLLIEYTTSGRSAVTLIKPKPDKDEDPPREVAKAWIGVATQPVTKKLAEQLGLGDQLGFRVTRVYPGTTADAAGLKTGDIILALNDEKLRPQGNQDAGLFQRNVKKLDIDGQAKLTVLRGVSESQDAKPAPLTINVQLERTRLTQEEARRDVNRDFELTVRELTFFDRDEHRWDESVKGVLVAGVESAGWAALGGIRGGDLIQKIDDNEITDLKSYRGVMEQITKEQPTRIVFVVLRGVSTHFQYVEPEWSPKAEENKPEEEKPEAAQKAAP